MSMKFTGRWNGSRVRYALASAFALIFLAHAAFSQATSGVTGIVADATGSVVSGATVTLIDTKTDRTLTTTTNEQGSYSFNNVQPGEAYRLTFAAPGFQTTSLSNVTLGVAKIETYDATLTPGNVSATVDVVASGTGET